MIIPIHLATAAVLSVWGKTGSLDLTVPFSRIYTTGEKIVYASEMDFNAVVSGPATFDMLVTTKKVLDTGRASLLFHWSNLKEPSDKKSEIPPDATVITIKNNLSDKFDSTTGLGGFVAAIFQLAAATADKPVKVGAESPIGWSGGDVDIKGTVKLLEVSPDKKQMKTLVKAEMVVKGETVGQFKFNFVDDYTTCRLISSDGGFSVGHSKLTFKFTAKPQG